MGVEMAWQQMQEISAGIGKQSKQTRDTERERRRAEFSGTERRLHQERTLIDQATNLVVPMLQQIEINAPQIQRFHLHDVTREPHYREIFSDGMGTKAFLFQNTVTLRWGTKFDLTYEEKELISRCQRSRFPLLVRNAPKEILKHDFYQIPAFISRDTIMVGSGVREGQIIDTQKFVEDPTKILLGFVSALAVPDHRRSVLQKRLSYR